MDTNAKRKRIWKDLRNINRIGGMISAAEAVAGLNNHDLDALAQDLLAKGKTLTPFEEWIAVFVKHEALDRGKMAAAGQRAGEEGSPYRLITEREARRPAEQKSAALPQ